MPVMMRVVASVRLCVSVSFVSSVAARNYPPGVLRTELPQRGSAAKPPVGGRGTKSPRNKSSLQTSVYRFRLQKTIKICKFRTIHLLILDQSVPWWGLGDIFGCCSFRVLTCQTSLLVCRYIFRIPRSSSYIKVIGSRSRSQEQYVIGALGHCITFAKPSMSGLLYFLYHAYIRHF